MLFRSYRKTLGKRTTFVLRPDHEFLRLFQSGGKLPGEGPSAGP